jgi:hypothetical protein
MSFSEEASLAMESWFGPDIADAVVYNGAAIRGHLDHAPDAEPRSGSVMSRALLQVRRQDVPDPKYRDAAVVAGIAWRVLRIEAGDEWTWTLALYREERPTP